VNGEYLFDYFLGLLVGLFIGTLILNRKWK
jgi:hypothetical protein